MWTDLQKKRPWPDQRPACSEYMHGWLCQDTKNALAQFLPCETVIELGSWLGKSAKWMLQHGAERIVCVDTWNGDQFVAAAISGEVKGMLERGEVFERFCVNLWAYRHRVIAIRDKSTVGLKLCHAEGIQPQLIYIDTAHDENTVWWELVMARSLFPDATLVGDDWQKDGVKKAVLKQFGKADHNNHAWWYDPAA